MDAFSGYNQIKMDIQDWEQTAFITHSGVFWFWVMLFGLINTGATFQQMMDSVFGSRIGRNIQAYVESMIAKSKLAKNHVHDHRENFENVRIHKMRLNLSKCSFGLTSGKLLGFLISQRGIEAETSQIKAIIKVRDPTMVKEVQKLIGCIAALRRFTPQASKKCLPFFQIIKEAFKSPKIIWNEEC